MFTKPKLLAEADFQFFYQNLDKTFNKIVIFSFAERNFHHQKKSLFQCESRICAGSDGEITTNELFRIGGYNSFRGFNEQSLFTDFYAFGGVEYRYLVSNQSIFDVFGQLANVRNSSLKTTSKLYSFGLGLIFFTDWFDDFSDFQRTRI